MTWMDFAIRLLVGFFLGVGIGIERQWLRSRAILKTNVLVTLGAAMFVMLSIMTPGDASPTRISAQIVSGVGFLGGGVILREGASVRGTNTAATLWCAAAIGTLVGSGHLVQAYFGTFAVVSANLLLRPLVEAFRQPEDNFVYRDGNSTYWEDKPEESEIFPVEEKESLVSQQLSEPENSTHARLSLKDAREQKIRYICYLTCAATSEKTVLTMLLESAKEREWQLIQLDSKNIINHKERENVPEEMVEIKVDFLSHKGYLEPKQIEEIVSSLKSEYMVSSISWQFAM